MSGLVHAACAAHRLLCYRRLSWGVGARLSCAPCCYDNVELQACPAVHASGKCIAHPSLLGNSALTRTGVSLKVTHPCTMAAISTLSAE